jgi:predicted NBD/HSP70 family sugar kinase
MTISPRGNRDLMRAMNRSIILNTIKHFGPIGRADVARRTGLSASTVTGITGELIAEELIFEKQPGDSSGGRPPILLDINPRGGYVVGIKLMEDHVIGALTDLEATVLEKNTLPLAEPTPECVVETIARLVDQLLLPSGITRHKLMGVGVGLAGIVDLENGISRKSPFFGWRDLPLCDLLQQRIEAPVSIENDVNTLTLAESLFGSGQGVSHFLTITVGRGIGLGIVVNGQFYRGAGGGAGEFGHTVIVPDGAQCDCGKFGCLEAYVGDRGLMDAARAQAALATVQSPDELLRLANEGNAAAQEVFAHAGVLLGRSVANLVNLFNPQRILISGEGVRYGHWMFDSMRTAVQQNAMQTLLADVEIRLEPWGDDVWARGAASLVLRQLFESPVHQMSSVIAE